VRIAIGNVTCPLLETVAWAAIAISLQNKLVKQL